MNFLSRIFVLTGMLIFASSCVSQITHPKASPLSIVQQNIGLSTVQIEYSRPAVRGRHVFGYQKDGQKGLVPYERIWRVGANESTKITVDSDVEIQGNVLAKGTYALYAFPNEAIWQIAFHTNTEHWGDGRKNYNANEDAFRVAVKPQKIHYHQENFLISFDSISHDAANLNLIWERTKVTIPLKVDTHAKMELEIAKQLMEKPTAQTYYEAARYLQEQGKHLERALGYLNTAVALGGDTYYFHRVKSLVQAELGDYRQAISSANKSLRIAQKLAKDEFVRMNKENIAKWKLLLD